MEQNAVIDVETLARQVVNPADYFMGLDAAPLGRPKNILMFTREYLGDRAHIDSQHHRFVLINALRKAGDVCLNGRIIHLKEGHALLVFPHQLHHYLNVNVEMFWLFITFEFDTPECIVALRDNAVPISPESNETLRKLLASYPRASPFEAQPADYRKVPACLSLLLEEMLEDIPPRTGEAAASVEVAAPKNVLIIDKMNNLIYNNLRGDLANAAIAEHVGVSTSHLRFIVRTTLGIGMGQYVKQVRINHSVALLAESRLTVSQIAVECGFSSVFAFSRAFKRMMGAPPSKYGTSRQGH